MEVEDHIENKCTFVGFIVFVQGKSIYMLILLFPFASKLCLVFVYIIFYQINSINQSEVGLKESSKKKLVRSIWAGRVEKMEDEKLAKRTVTQKVEGK